MAIFGNSNSALGLDIGSSSTKLVELTQRKNRTEVTAYASAGLVNPLVNISSEDSDAAIKQAAALVKKLVASAESSADRVIAALPGSVVFSTVLEIADLADSEMGQAVQFAARDVVPANLSDMILSWARLGSDPHTENPIHKQVKLDDSKTSPPNKSADGTVPIFVTAAPKDIVSRYTETIKQAGLNLAALEVETFPLSRSLLEDSESGLIIDIGDLVTTYHIIDTGTPRVSHSLEVGGQNLTQAIANSENVSSEEADQIKIKFGLSDQAPDSVKAAIMPAIQPIFDQAGQLLNLYTNQSGRNIKKIIYIGGSANLKGLISTHSKLYPEHTASIGDPWRGLSYPDALSDRIQNIGPNFAVAVGLAERGIIVT